MVADPRTRTPQSRRDRPAKPALSREGIVDHALAILQKEGLGKVTMRRIASALDTGPASLYVYVRDTEDLHAQILDALIGRMPRPSGRGPWRERLHELLGSYGELLSLYPEIARMALAAQPLGVHYFTLVESVLDLLAEGGIPDETAAWGIDMLFASVTASAVEHAANADGDGDAERLVMMAAALAVASESTHPRTLRLGNQMLAGTGSERFRWGLDVLINGLLHTPRPASAPPRDD
ncbi:TetR/AcrR family transcriptional regulator C-terminal domain-containing protein [Leifsonia sp. ZF2019]|uniref:TetR/AcrR family transcriptional regulator n=1 Tax=Leifsonia sp. ZF2019 TaxID=2781978 RepID=UPI001CBC25E8|nr:TetR/AcrR family transcriptional regulator C-terminal domain-containing protein [Leifsonia sp. ZF2019]UAJ79321.1 TetR/AcrR family transcriptional regulator C-terminal domain-containing protein [Leifsonia sp. ZF2019]